MSYNSVNSTLDNSEGRFIHFLQRQVRQLSEKGLPVLFRKCHNLLLFLLFVLQSLVILPFVSVVRLLRVLVVIRFGPLRSERIGHFAVNTELYLCERDAGMNSRKTFDIFYHTSPICNHQLKRMWDRRLRVYCFARPMDRLNRLLPGGESHVITMPSDRDIYGLMAHTQIHLSFTPEEEHLGRRKLLELGVRDGSSFVCFHARDQAYLDAIEPGRNWDYHDYRDSSIHNYIPAAEKLVHRGYYAIRMGAIVKEPLTTLNPGIIDYATKGRTDFLDIYLSAKCQFFICSATGMYSIPMIFRRPIVYVNYIPLEYVPTWGRSDLFIPKKLFLLKENRFMSFREIIESGVGRFLKREEYEHLGLEIHDNTPEEITAVTIEMDERLKGIWQTTEEDEELLRRFRSLFKPGELHAKIVSRIGAEFLRQNRKLLD